MINLFILVVAVVGAFNFGMLLDAKENHSGLAALLSGALSVGAAIALVMKVLP